MLKKILIGLVVVIGVFAVIVALQPAELHVERSATMATAPAAVFQEVNDFHRWDAWSPWAKLDPNMETTFEGAPAGTGAIYTWNGNSDVGAGRMTLIESRPHELIRINLEFLKPFESTSTTSFTFRPEGDQTVVTWAMDGENNFLAKAFALFVNMDTMLGNDFDKGLAQLKVVAEAKP